MENNWENVTIGHIHDEHITIGGCCENILDIAANWATDLCIERDNEGRFRRDYEQTVRTIVELYSDAWAVEVLSYDAPDGAHYASEVKAAIQIAMGARNLAAEKMDDDTFYSAQLWSAWGYVQRICNHLCDSKIVVSHHNDRGEFVAREVYHFGTPDTIERTANMIAEVFAISHHTREDIERAVNAMGDTITQQALDSLAAQGGAK